MCPENSKVLMSANTGFSWKWANRQAINRNEKVELALPKIKLPERNTSIYLAPPINVYFQELTGVIKWSMPLEAQIKSMNDELEKEIAISIKKTSFIKCLKSDNEKTK